VTLVVLPPTTVTDCVTVPYSGALTVIV
jgi:hypothetical protein